MSEVTRILSAIEQGDPSASAQLLPFVYDELRKLAAHKMAQEAPGQTLQATALVHEAYLRLVASPLPVCGRGNLFQIRSLKALFPCDGACRVHNLPRLPSAAFEG
jgi:hypothetical protein